MLAERTALLVGGSTEELLEADRAVNDLYGRRSGVLHRQQTVDEDDIADAGQLVWRACRAFLELLPEITDSGDFRDWTLRRRYS